MYYVSLVLTYKRILLFSCYPLLFFTMSELWGVKELNRTFRNKS